MPMTDAAPSSVPVTATLLGTGTSTGIPVIGCRCRVCTSADPRDQRSRAACYVDVGGCGLLIDAGPDLRAQALREALPRVDAVLVTHHHFDHVAGLDDLRPYFFRERAPIPCYAPPSTAAVLRERFQYIFADGSYPGVPQLQLCEVEAAFDVVCRGDGAAAPVTVQPVPVYHGDLPMYGYRIGRFAYLTDTSRIPERSFDLLRGLDVLVLDALRREPHPTHYSIDEAVAVARRIGARQTYFTHMTHSVLHAEEDAALPPGINLAYDGLQVRVDG